MSDARFETPEGFLAWIGQAGNNVVFPYGDSKGWKVQIIGGEKPQVIITSNFYEVKPSGPYGAPQSVGYLVTIGGAEASGIVMLGFDEQGKPAVKNRRRLVQGDQLGEGQGILNVVQAQPDRVNEPVLVVLEHDDADKWRSLTAQDWLEFYRLARDGVELVAIQALYNWVNP